MLEGILIVMFAVSLGLFGYVGWCINRKRRALRYVSIQERQKFRRIVILATFVFFTAFTALGSLAVMQ